MDKEDFIETVRQEASLESTDKDREITIATLQTFGERITDGEASDVAVHLPDTLADVLMDMPSEAEPFSFDEFIE